MTVLCERLCVGPNTSSAMVLISVYMPSIVPEFRLPCTLVLDVYCIRFVCVSCVRCVVSGSLRSWSVDGIGVVVLGVVVVC